MGLTSPRARVSTRGTPGNSVILRALAAVGGALLALGLAGCGGHSPAVTLVHTTVPAPPVPAPPVPAPPVPAETPAPPDPALAIGPGAVDTVGGWLPDGVTLSPFDSTNPILSQLDPMLLRAVQEAARSAQTQGIELRVTSGWRSAGFQQRLFDEGVRDYGSVEAAAEFVAPPGVSKHVTGQAIDIGPAEAARWLIAHGNRFGLCQIYANEIWHFELVADAQGNCPPLRPNAAG
ncbi:MAG: M15 family metallopeptidase [Actinomycetia bacterium]|nr:M15 family metallopeptidase [Actinomycetes bacterium]